MAGLGFKDFQVGEVLTSANVDGYLMQQTVMRFPDSAARGSALGTAAGTGVALAEGMVSYLDDVNAVEVYDGTTWTSPVAGVGRNVVQTVKTDTFTTTSATYTGITGLTASITPTSNTSKVLIIVQLTASTGSESSHFRLSGGNTSSYVGDASSSRVRNVMNLYDFGGDLEQGSTQNPVIIVYLDSPATTSSVTYGVEARKGATGTVWVNRSSNDTNTADYGRGASSITLIEVAA